MREGNRLLPKNFGFIVRRHDHDIPSTIALYLARVPDMPKWNIICTCQQLLLLCMYSICIVVDQLHLCIVAIYGHVYNVRYNVASIIASSALKPVLSCKDYNSTESGKVKFFEDILTSEVCVVCSLYFHFHIIFVPATDTLILMIVQYIVYTCRYCHGPSLELCC